jgi:8-oxo-dGTP diphosphatase
MVDSTWKSDEIERYVAGAVVADGGCALVLRRNADDFMGGLWELPSGRRESAEKMEEALAREVLEETGLRVRRVGPQVDRFDYRSKSGTLTRQVNFVVEVEPGEPTLTEHDAFAWVTLHDLSGLDVSDETRATLRSALGRGPACEDVGLGDTALKPPKSL